ncbi:MAG: hypothetical protein K6G57_05225 [Lachnospiraceae bacterium]|nr:hypothetical protein [Lachnospiraceae bacterium]
MELMHPQIIWIGLPVLAVVIAALHFIPARKKPDYMGGIRTGAAALTKSLPIYEKLLKKSRVLTLLLESFIIIAVISSMFLAARPYEVKNIKTGVQKRDIFLCMDVSYSLYQLNYELTDYLEQVVTELKGDRFGVTIFNTSSVVYVPMTDDYDYVVSRLEELKTYFELQKEFYDLLDGREYLSELSSEEVDKYYELEARLGYIESGTLVNNYERGSSLIGEGLASCLYSFPSIGDSSRTRCIIFATDNANSAAVQEVPPLNEACDLCKKNEVTVFSIFPHEDAHYYLYDDSDYEGFQDELRECVGVTGGELYIQSDQDTVASIVESIRAHKAMTVNEIVTEQQTDVPSVPMAFMLIGIAGALFSGIALKRR